jgi:hypothetical protein
MTEKTMQDENDPRSPEHQWDRNYEPPTVTRIKLRPEEAVLGACKVSGAAGPVATSCRSVGMSCRAIGS